MMYQRQDRPAYTYRKSKDTLTRMTAVKLGPMLLDLVVHPRELVRDGGVGFACKFSSALQDAPRTLVVNLTAAHLLDEEGREVLRSAQIAARMRGIEFRVRPSSRAALGHLATLGMEDMLPQAA